MRDDYDPSLDRSLRTLAAVCLIVVACTGRRQRAANADPAPAVANAPAPTSCPSGTVLTSAGCVRGTVVDKVTAFRGIPYAAPPIGALRWKPPAPAVAWQGVREGSAFGKSCPQLDTTIGGKLDTDEDCLTVNVWTPSTQVGAKLPVMFWIHGGGLTQGGSAMPTYDGQHLAAIGGVVVVSINYRLGPLGFLAHPAFSAEDPHHASGNLGVQDQIAGLEWVKANIARFGGDAKSITIFGESAGGESVCTLLASRLAKGLFARAVIESAQCVSYGSALRALTKATGKTESGEAQGLRIAKALGCDGDGVAACLRGKTADEIVHASPAAFGFLGKGEHYGLTVDGFVLLDAPATLLANGQLADVPMIIGTNADEGTLFTAKMPIARPVGYFAIVAKMFPGVAREIIAQYAPATFGSPKQAFDALVSDVVFTCPTRRTARLLRAHEAHVYRYLFAHVTAKGLQTHMGAMHGSEIPFVFDTVSAPTDEERALATQMLGYWTHFARTGDPNSAGAPPWPAYDATKDSYLELQTPIAARDGLHTAACDLLDSLAPTQQPEQD